MSVPILNYPTMFLGLFTLCLSYLLPGHYPPWNSFEQQALAAFGVALVAAAVFAAHARVRVSSSAWVALAAAAVAPVQWVSGQIVFLSDALLSSLYLVALALSIAAGATHQRVSDLSDGLAVALIAAGIVSTALAVVQWLNLSWGIFSIDMRPGGRPYGNLAQPNHLATLLALSVMAVLGQFERRRISAVVAALAVSWFAFGMAMSQSRTGWFFVVMLGLWWAVMHRRVGLRLDGRVMAGGIVLFAALVLGWERLSDALLLPTGSLEERLHAGTRWLHWQTLVDAALQAPWSGYGWTQIALAQQAAVLAHPASHEWLRNSHNLVLDLVLWNGIPLGLLLFGAIVWWVVRQIRCCRSADQWIWLGSIGALLLHGLLEYPLDYTYFLLPVGLMMGMLEGVRDPVSRVQVRRWMALAVLAGTIGMLAWVSLEYLRVQDGARQLRFAMIGVDAENPAAQNVPDVVLLDAPREYHRFLLTLARPGLTESELDWMRDVSLRHAVPPAMLRYALAAGLNGRKKEAEDTLARICKMHPEPRCDEGRAAWALLQQRYDVLSDTKMPLPLSR